MIVDDEYVLMGSANINQRSMDGSRDTEIAMGANQPHYSWAGGKKAPRGQAFPHLSNPHIIPNFLLLQLVYEYRMSLWAENLGTLEECFSWPHSVECVQMVNEMAQENWGPGAM
ncbi:hypothetical protein E2562_012065 [Oryza meyeriana var. granulata]|uniref:phospholipase D n=1 Tax=Oryza meyeriana var. granulata TaxID=110450 RepID=A0A6G1D157_9ORYZ|nr:hypothetical protein E2562_012065 [Oryza meyeriana var. granulata]